MVPHRGERIVIEDGRLKNFNERKERKNVFLQKVLLCGSEHDGNNKNSNNGVYNYDDNDVNVDDDDDDETTKIITIYIYLYREPSGTFRS